MEKSNQMKKIGILTEYYESINYGGTLQAYALCKVLNDIGYDAEQISYLKSEERRLLKENKIKISMLKRINPIYQRRRFISYCLNSKLKRKMEGRQRKFTDFRETMIPHSKYVFDDDTLKECVGYDDYIVGSDQVWNPNFHHPGYMLSFASKEKKRISYAASLGIQNLTNEQKEFFRNNLKNFDAISVREVDAVDMLQELTKVKIEQVLDPTLLLEQEQWNAICTNCRIQEKYIFAYYLGDDLKQRRVTEEFAKKNNLKIVFIPHVSGNYRICDKEFGDIRLYDVSPGEFVALIKHAEYVFTDSFHAVAFSGIYHKQFFVFTRTEYKTMSSRIYSITNMFDAETHFCDTQEKQELEYIENVEKIKYEKMEKLFFMKKKSLDFLKKNL